MENNMIDNLCIDNNIDLINLEYFEEEEFQNESYEFDFRDPWAVCSRGYAENKIKLESLYDILFKKSYGALKYAYRMGFDVDTGKRTAIQFELNPESIPAVDNEYMTSRHINHLNKPQKVLSIFHQDGRPLKSVSIIPTFDSNVINLFDYIFMELKTKKPELFKRIVSDYDKKIKLFMKLDLFQKMFVLSTKELPKESFEDYHINENDDDKQGDGRYKSTKLFWSNEKFISFIWSTPTIRGCNRDYASYNVNDKSKKDDVETKIINSLKYFFNKFENNSKSIETKLKELDLPEINKKYIRSHLNRIDKIIGNLKNTPDESLAVEFKNNRYDIGRQLDQAYILIHKYKLASSILKKESVVCEELTKLMGSVSSAIAISGSYSGEFPIL